MDILESEIQVLTGFDKEMRESALPIWFESLVGVDWTLLHISPVYYGFGVPKGDGAATIVVPGFLGSDVYLYELYLWLGRIGYKPYLSNIGWNADCLNTLSEKLIETIKTAHEETGRKVNLIGHSLGGVLSRSAAIQHPELSNRSSRSRRRFAACRRIRKFWKCRNASATAFSATTTKPIFRTATRALPLQRGHGSAKFPAETKSKKPPSTQKATASLTGTTACSRFDENNFEVSGTHIGLVYNFQVYKIIAERLSKA